MYKLTFPNGKIYVGSTCDLQRRIYGHRSKSAAGKEYAVCRAWRVHGEPVVDVLENVPATEDLIAAEQRWLDELQPWASTGVGYNMSRLADRPDPELSRRANTGRVVSPATRAKISAARAGWRHTEESRARISASLQTNAAQTEHLRRLAEARRGQAPGPETRAKLSAACSAGQREYLARLGVAGRAARKREIRDTKRARGTTGVGRPVSDETRAKISAAHKGRRHGPEQVAAMRAGVRAYLDRLGSDGRAERSRRIQETKRRRRADRKRGPRA